MADSLVNSGDAAAISTTVIPELTIIDGVIYTTSLQVAQHFGKRHDTVLRAIKNLVAQLSGDPLRNFAEGYYTLPETGDQQHTLYQITRDGFSLLGMGFTGKEALQWKLAFLAEFNRREAELIKLTAPALPTTIAPEQCQHLRELVDLVVETGKQGYPDTWSRLHRKMKVNSYLNLRPDQFNEAVAYLQGKMDGQSMAALVQKHFPDAVKSLPAPEAAQQANLTLQNVTALITGDLVSPQVKQQLATALNMQLFREACNNPNRGYGREVVDKIPGLGWAELHEINVAAQMEVLMRSMPKTPGAVAAYMAA